MIVAHEELTLAMLPAPGAPWDELAPFCLTHDGYLDGRRDVEALRRLADRVMAQDLAAASLEDLRSALFYWQRKVRWADLDPVPADIIAAAHAVIAELRRRLGG